VTREKPSLAAIERPFTVPLTTLPVVGAGGVGLVDPSEASTPGGTGRDASASADGEEPSPEDVDEGEGVPREGEVAVLVAEASAPPTSSSSSVATWVPVAHATKQTSKVETIPSRERLEFRAFTRGEAWPFVPHVQLRAR
jgi:hypothetical protein